MAKAKPSLSGLIRRTEEVPLEKPLSPAGDDLPATGHTVPVGVGLRESELAVLDEIVEQIGVSRNALLRYATRDFIKRFRRGEIDLTSKIVEPPPRRKRLSID